MLGLRPVSVSLTSCPVLPPPTDLAGVRSAKLSSLPHSKKTSAAAWFGWTMQASVASLALTVDVAHPVTAGGSGMMIRLAAPLRPSLVVAVTLTVSGARAVTSPVCTSTWAAVRLRDCQLTTLPLSAIPC